MHKPPAVHEFVFFRHHYCYRTPLVLAGSIALLFLAVAAAAGTFYATRRESFEVLPLAAFSAFAVLAPLVSGVFLLRNYLQRASTPLIVSTFGIRYGKKSWPWEQIARLYATPSTNGLRLMLMLRSASFTRHLEFSLTTTPGLTEAEYLQLLHTVQTFLDDAGIGCTTELDGDLD